MARRSKLKPSKSLLLCVMVLVVGAGPLGTPEAYAADLTPRSLRVSNSLASAIGVSYQPTFTIATSGLVGSIAIQFCQEGPLPFTACSQPPGFDASGALLATQSGVTGLSIFGGSTANEIILTRPPTPATAGTVATYSFIGITNPSSDGALFVRILTFASSDASGPATDTGGLVVSINPPATINAEVPPYLLFCLGESITGFNCASATEPFSDIGTLGPLVTGAAQTQMVVATNAANGYSLWVLGGTMTSGNNTIPAMAGGPSTQGVSQFGINLRANAAPIVGQDITGPGVGAADPAYNVPNQFRYQSGDTLATAATADDFRKYTVSYIVNVATGQPGGVYATTLNYVALANF